MSCSIYHKKGYVMKVNSVLSSNVQNFINNNNNNNNKTFKSRVVEVYSSNELTSADRHFINKYEESLIANKVPTAIGRFSLVNRFNSKHANIDIFQNDREEKVSIKTLKPLMLMDSSERYCYGSLFNEYYMRKKASEVTESVQKPLAYVFTERNNNFLISETINGVPIAIGENIELFGNRSRMNSQFYQKTLKALRAIDNAGVFNPVFDRNNVMVDYQNAPRISGLRFAHSFRNGQTLGGELFSHQFATFEKVSNITSFEGNAFADYLLKTTSRRELKEYLKNRSEFAEEMGKDNEFESIKAEVHKNPSNDIADAELLRMAFLKNHNLYENTIDVHKEFSNDLLKSLKYAALATQAAESLMNFEPNDRLSNSEVNYFEKMRNYGKQMIDRHFNQYEGTIGWLYTLLEAAKKSKDFSLSKIKIFTISKANLFKMLSEGSKASETWKSYEKKLGNILGKM